MKVVIATDSFKGTMTSVQAGQAIREGVRRAWPEAEVITVPMADGGEGTVDAVLAGSGGRKQVVEVRDPLGRSVTAEFGLLADGRTAIIEMASSSGLPLVSPEERDPTCTSSYGTGQQMVAALDAGASRLLVGVGGSATVDGGCGCAQALGVRFIARNGAVLPPGLAGGDLNRVAHIDVSARDSRIETIELTVLCDVDNPLCGRRGAASVYGPQKGATPIQVATLDRNLAHLAKCIQTNLGVRVADLPGAGAAGGLGAGLVAFAGASIKSGVECVIALTAMPHAIRGADLVITGEGRIDAQSLRGKVVSGVARCARSHRVSVIAFAGSEGPGADQCLSLLDAYYTVTGPDDPVPDRTEVAMELLATQVARSTCTTSPP